MKNYEIIFKLKTEHLDYVTYKYKVSCIVELNVGKIINRTLVTSNNIFKVFIDMYNSKWIIYQMRNAGANITQKTFRKKLKEFFGDFNV